MAKMRKLKLQGFNNLTKTLSFNIYDICYAANQAQQQQYIEYIDEAYNADRLKMILTEVVNIVGAKILNIAHQDYDPIGASVTVLICEEPGLTSHVGQNVPTAELEQLAPDTILAHLDKSHVTVHTYPEMHPDEGISTFRVDIDVSTCGTTSPLNALNFLIHNFESDIITLDYRVRGFTRDVKGKKHYIDHKINSIQNYLSKDVQKRYQMIDVNVYQENLFHTKMMLNEFDLNNYLFGMDAKDLSAPDQQKIRKQLFREMFEIFYGQNVTSQEVGEPFKMKILN